MTRTFVVLAPLVLLALAATGCSSKKKASGGLAEFQGEWDFVEFNSDGEIQKPAVLRKLKLKVADQKFQILVNDKVVDDFTFTLDESKSPGEIDLEYVSGKEKGKKDLGIYLFEDGKLKICTTGAGGGRPTQFVVAAGSGHSLMVFSPRK